MNINVDLKNYRIEIIKEVNKENCSYYIKKNNNQKTKFSKIMENRIFQDITEKIIRKTKNEKKNSLSSI